MNASEKLCVVIPVHKPLLTNEETISLLACYNYLKEYDCFLLFPEGMDTFAYVEIFPSLILKPVLQVWLASVKAYNQMKTSMEFYGLFPSYDFLMTYELDAFIFSNEIKNHFGYYYDFIGAPMVSNNIRDEGLNSGFSIRNIKACMSVIKKLKAFKVNWKLKRFIYWNIPFAKKLIREQNIFLLKDGYLKAFYRHEYFHEDYIFTKIIPLLFVEFNVAPFEKALQFSFESQPELLFKKNGNKLPLGCHAWVKNLTFWKDFIKL